MFSVFTANEKVGVDLFFKFNIDVNLHPLSVILNTVVGAVFSKF